MRVFLVSAVVLHREGLAELLNRRDGIEATGVAGHADGGLARALAGDGPAVVVLDLAGVDAAEATARVVRCTDARVIAINVPPREGEVIACAEAGVACCLTPEASLDQLVRAIESVGRGESPCSPWTSAVLLRRVAALARERHAGLPSALAEPAHPRLTARELEIVELIDRGLSNKEIAAALCIEVPTVKNHVHRILDKLGVRRRADAAALVRGGHVRGGGRRAGTEPLSV